MDISYKKLNLTDILTNIWHIYYNTNVFLFNFVRHLAQLLYWLFFYKYLLVYTDVNVKTQYISTTVYIPWSRNNNFFNFIKELDYQKRTNKDLQTDFARLKEILKQRDKLIEDSGLILYTDNELNEDGTHKSNGDSDSPGNEIKSVLPAALVAPETAKLLDMMGEGTIDDKLRKLLENKSDLKEQNNRLKSELEDERIRISSLEKKLANHASKIQDNQENAQDLHEIQRQYTKEINEFKMKNQKLDHENIVIKQDVSVFLIVCFIFLKFPICVCVVNEIYRVYTGIIGHVR